mmetsp:Transcript_91135/g.262847  ORF Transcript_91135/g.262847 Transcript_91135/m.262847 type:complete len:252 (+) Transcript_91135:1752-2507(+)
MSATTSCSCTSPATACTCCLLSHSFLAANAGANFVRASSTVCLNLPSSASAFSFTMGAKFLVFVRCVLTTISASPRALIAFFAAASVSAMEFPTNSGSPSSSIWVLTQSYAIIAVSTESSAMLTFSTASGNMSFHMTRSNSSRSFVFSASSTSFRLPLAFANDAAADSFLALIRALSCRKSFATCGSTCVVCGPTVAERTASVTFCSKSRSTKICGASNASTSANLAVKLVRSSMMIPWACSEACSAEISA